MALNTKTSIVDLLKSKGLPTDAGFRAKVYESMGLGKATEYGAASASGAGNIALLEKFNAKPDLLDSLAGAIKSAGGANKLDLSTIFGTGGNAPVPPTGTPGATGGTTDQPGGSTPPTGTPGGSTPQLPSSIDEINKMQDEAVNGVKQASTDFATASASAAENAKNTITKIRGDLGLDQLEKEYTDLYSTIKASEADIRKEAASTGGVVTESQIQASVADRNKALIPMLELKKAQLDNRTKIVGDIIDLTQDNYQNALSTYNAQYRAAQDTMLALERRQSNERTADNLLRDDARANLTVLHNSIKGSGKTWNEIPDATKRNIRELEAKAGLPSGLTETFVKSMPKADIVTTIEGVNPRTNEKTISIIYRDEDGKVRVGDVQGTGTYAPRSTTTTTPTAGLDVAGITSLFEKNTGDDKWVNTEIYGQVKAEARKLGTKALAAFDKLFPPEEFLNPNDTTAKKFFQTSTRALSDAEEQDTEDIIAGLNIGK